MTTALRCARRLVAQRDPDAWLCPLQQSEQIDRAQQDEESRILE
jgi:hypothetical protein